jgi:general secretion pathway protein I
MNPECGGCEARVVGARRACRSRRHAELRPGARIEHCGFTLIEVLVSLVIVSLVLAAAMRATGLLTTTQQALTAAAMAAWSAENRLAEMRLDRVLPPLGQTSSSCPQADLSLVCRVEVTASPNPAIRRVDVRVVSENEPEHALARRTAFLSILP